MCIGCLVDDLPHTCGYEPPPVIPDRWRYYAERDNLPGNLPPAGDIT